MSLSGMIIVAGIAMSAPAALQTGTDLPHATIAVDDIDLSTDAGQGKLRVRLAREIRRMCDMRGPVDTYMSGLRSTCIKTASDEAEAAFAQAVASARQRSGFKLAAR